MFTYNIFYGVKSISNFEWVQILNFERPFFDTSTLDESLDGGQIVVRASEELPLTPFTPLKIAILENGVNVKTLYRLAMKVNRVLKKFSGEELYEYTINTVEWTKWLERTVCDNLTFTNSSAKAYAENFAIAEPEVSRQADIYFTEGNVPSINEPIAVGGTIVMPAMRTFLTPKVPPASGALVTWSDDSYLKTTSPSGVVNTIPQPAGGSQVTVTLNEAGSWTIEYYAAVDITSDLMQFTLGNTYIYTIGNFEENAPPADYTIGDVLRRLVKYGATRRSGEAQRYTYTGSEYNNFSAPEFFLSDGTMFDCALTVGNAIHAIPRLEYISDTSYLGGVKGNLVFDRLGEVYEVDVSAQYSAEQYDIEADEYCGSIDSTVENLLTTINPLEGSLQYPCYNGYVTPRSEEIKISNDTAVIGGVQQNIYKVTKLYINYNNLGEKDITAFVNEKAAYDTLASYKGEVYPYSKSYALCYKMGDNKITGLSFKAEDATTIQTAWQKPAIVNIINAVYGAGTIPNSSIANFAYKDLKFNVIYIPYINARVKQLRPQADREFANTLIFNQNGSTIESNYYGKMLSGVIARLGNNVLVRTYKFATYTELPRVGQILALDKNYYIAVVSAEYEQNYIKVTLTMTPDYNRLSSYLGINSNYRQFDVSEKQSVNRYMNFGEVCLVGSRRNLTNGVNNFPFLSAEGIEQISRLFTKTSGNQASLAIAQGEYENNDLTKLLLPCSSLAIGNSLAFIIEMQDNFGAGYQSQPLPTTSNEAEMVALRHLVPYSSDYGRLDKLNIKLYNEVDTSSITFPYDLPEYNGNENAVDEDGNEIYSMLGGAIDGIGLGALEVGKDNREAIRLTIQQHFVGDEGYEIGTGITELCPLVTETNQSITYAFVVSKLGVNALDNPRIFNANYDVIFNNPTISVSTTSAPCGFRLNITKPTLSDTYKSWGLYALSSDGKSGRLIVGKNGTISNSVGGAEVYFNFLDNENLRRRTL